MLFTEWKLEEAQQVWLEEGREEERLKTAERLEEERLEIARAMFIVGDSLEKIARNTGTSLDALKEKLLIQQARDCPAYIDTTARKLHQSTPVRIIIRQVKERTTDNGKPPKSDCFVLF